jgi:DNA invertase Pin-like site-specific DNA recombinase
MDTAYSYIRWSDVRQSDGDSHKRQVDLREGWLAAHPKVQLDTSLKLVDKGVSGFHGQHRSDKHCLGQFVRQVEAGRVRPGSFLLIENLDRLSREEVHDAVELLLKLTRLGVVVVQLSPVVCEFVYPVEMSKLIIAVVELARGNSESKMKSERVTNAWKSARERARTTGAVVNLRTLPGWCEVSDGEMRLIPERAGLVRRMHRMAREGYGVNTICRKLNDEGVKPWGRGIVWTEAVVYRYLTCRTVIGEWEPGTGGRGGVKRAKTGEVIKDYFPRVVSDKVFYATQAAMKERHGFRGRRGSHVNLLAGLLKDSQDGGSIGYSHEPHRRKSYVFNFNGRISLVPYFTYPSSALESQVLDVLRELDTAKLMGEDRNDGDDVMTWEGRVQEIDRQTATLKEALAGRDVKAVVDRLADLELERVEAVKGLEAAKRQAAVPSSESWGVIKGKVNMEDEGTRLRLRNAVRQVVKSVYCVFAGHKSGRYLGWLRLNLIGNYYRDVYLWADNGHAKGSRPASFGVVREVESGMYFYGMDEPLTDPAPVPEDVAKFRADALAYLAGDPSPLASWGVFNSVKRRRKSVKV